VGQCLSELEIEYKTKEYGPDQFLSWGFTPDGILTQTAPAPESKGLHENIVVFSMKNYRNWANIAEFLGGGFYIRFLGYKGIGTRFTRYEDYRVYMRRERKKVLEHMTRAVICLDACHPKRGMKDINQLQTNAIAADVISSNMKEEI
jgi:hypothetical protein